MLRQDDFNKSQLVLAGWRYGREYGGPKPAQMIMGVLANRFRAGWGSWLEIVERIPIFQAEENIPTGFPSLWAPEFVQLLHYVDGIYDGSGVNLAVTPDDKQPALYWADTRRIERNWFRANVIQEPFAHPRIIEFSSLALYR